MVYACGVLVAIAQSRFSRIALFIFSTAATKLVHSRANHVLKYLRWRNTDAQGQSPIGYRGEIFDLDPQAKLVGIREWNPEAKGQVGKFMASTSDWSSRSWVVAFKAEYRDWLLGGGPLRRQDASHPRH